MKRIFLTTALLACISTASEARDFITSSTVMSKEEQDQINFVKKQLANQGQYFSERKMVQSIAVRAIDGHEPAIEISQVQTSLPAEYAALPTSKEDMRKYVGR